MKLTSLTNSAMVNPNSSLVLLSDKPFVYYTPSKFSCDRGHFGETPKSNFEEASNRNPLAKCNETSYVYCALQWLSLGVTHVSRKTPKENGA